MFQAEVTAGHPFSNTTMSFTATSRKQRARKMNMLQPYLKITWSSIELDGSALDQEDPETAAFQVVEALKAAKANDRDELIIVNIAPGAEVGSAKVAEYQGKVEKAVEAASKKSGTNAPQMRLSLRGAEYDLRCYLGRTKPTDYTFDYDA